MNASVRLYLRWLLRNQQARELAAIERERKAAIYSQARFEEWTCGSTGNVPDLGERLLDLGIGFGCGECRQVLYTLKPRFARLSAAGSYLICERCFVRPVVRAK